MRFLEWLFLSFLLLCTSLAEPFPLYAEESLSVEPTENCDVYYEKAKRYAAEAEAIKIEGFGSVGKAAEKGGISGQAGAFATLYQSCLIRQNQKEKAP